MYCFINFSQLHFGSAFSPSDGSPPHACSNRIGTCFMISLNRSFTPSSRLRAYTYEIFLPCANSPPARAIAYSNHGTRRRSPSCPRGPAAVCTTERSARSYASLPGEHNRCSVLRVLLNAMNRNVGKKCTSEPGVPHITGQSGFGQPSGSTPLRWHLPWK
jgi:hypothetical protein